MHTSPPVNRVAALLVALAVVGPLYPHAAVASMGPCTNTFTALSLEAEDYCTVFADGVSLLQCENPPVVDTSAYNTPDHLGFSGGRGVSFPHAGCGIEFAPTAYPLGVFVGAVISVPDVAALVLVVKTPDGTVLARGEGGNFVKPDASSHVQFVPLVPVAPVSGVQRVQFVYHGPGDTNPPVAMSLDCLAFAPLGSTPSDAACGRYYEKYGYYLADEAFDCVEDIASSGTCKWSPLGPPEPV